jgi:hypothetical protein
MHEPTDDFLSKTRTFWQSRTDRQLTTEDARQIAENVTGFLQTLTRWQRDDRDERGLAVSQEDGNSPGTPPTRNEKKPPRKRRSVGTGEPLAPLLAAGNQPNPDFSSRVLRVAGARLNPNLQQRSLRKRHTRR